MSKNICIYHANCMDGFGAAWVVHQKFRDSCIFIAAQYGDEPPDVAGANVYLVDFSYKQDVMRKIAKQAKHITVIDHHKTAEADLALLLDNGTVYGNFDMKRSGAVLTWMWFFPHYDVPIFLKYIQDRDLWNWELVNSKEINAAMGSYKKDFKLWSEEFSILEGHNYFVNLVEEGTAIIRQQDAEIQHLASKAWFIQIQEWIVPTVNCSGPVISDLGNVLCQGHPFSATFFDMEGSRVYSLRSDENGEDVSEIAKHFGGGGHKHAAGFKVPLHIQIFRSH